MRVTPPSLPRSSLRRRGVLLGSGALLAAPAIVQAQGQTGVALVIGNSKYKWEASLPNARRDATDVAKAFPVGSDLDVIVLEADASGRRIRVSRKAVLEAQDAAELREYHERTQAAATPSVGALAEKLRGALEGKRTR